MLKKARKASKGPQDTDIVFDPNTLIELAGKDPSFSFRWGDPSKKKDGKKPNALKQKRRFIGHPNGSMRQLHHLFAEKLRVAITKIEGRDGYNLRILPTATGCLQGRNPLRNAMRHEQGEYFYITDFAHAYPSVDLERLTILLVFIFRYTTYGSDYTIESLERNELAKFAMRTDTVYGPMLSFVHFAFGGFAGKGLAVGGNLSPYLLNLYCEVFVNTRLRSLCRTFGEQGEPQRDITITQYVDDIVFSRGIVIGSTLREKIREIFVDAGFQVNHRKSKVLKRSMGTVFITKQGLRSPVHSNEEKRDAILVFPQKKRRRLHGIIKSYLVTGKNGTFALWNDEPEVIRGIIAEFIHYYKNVETPTATDMKTFALCKEFQEVSDKYRRRYKGKRPVDR